ncbi:bifunctional aspartate kinase/homoserine dehydrogenase I [Flavobacterium psychrotolerans]|uniref:Bifunctional aspartate kinase/homoserine dehydrogenase I n=1 Tax=Flavobacterium psychrotolerans TaxID=2169410 RepID=A0A2U1JN62_9FLAO|nr:bifunctional aspartate kinase/homoserine dehydrogenase I [Flavobacterium psychrotolerans]PWA06606.1 bifunctional aspartate kinase/homoserine dehydrogenase I [Flavobacterium psychrotolerans]
MENKPTSITIQNFTTESGAFYATLNLSFQVFGSALNTGPIVLVNHALTGNSQVIGTNGWWNDLIGKNKTIDTNIYTILAFNVPGNGYDNFIIENYLDFNTRDIARLFIEGIKYLKIKQLFAIIGGSVGGGVAWEMVALEPKLTRNLIPIASDWKSTDWLIANCYLQEKILNNSSHPIEDARIHAMMCYRTPESFKEKFQRTSTDSLESFQVESWLNHHGEKLQKRFQLSAYKMMNQLLKTIDITRNRTSFEKIISEMDANIYIIGINSDLFFTANENRETYQEIKKFKNNVFYSEIDSQHGHDAFLMEYDQLSNLLDVVFKNKKDKMKILKFGGKSLANGEGINKVLDIITDKKSKGENIAIVVSARGNATDELGDILTIAVKNGNYKPLLESFKSYQLNDFTDVDLSEEFATLDKLFEGVSLIGDYSEKIKDQVLSQGEVISAKTITSLLNKKGIKAQFADSRELIKTDSKFGDAQPLEQVSKKNIIQYFKKNNDSVNVITGFIGSNNNNETTTLGRNGSNYTASLIANYIDAEELQNYTHVDGIYTANPELVPDAKKIDYLSFNEANELANFGATILHAKTIVPLLEKNIPLRILNTFNYENQGTLITSKSNKEGIKTLSVLENVALVNLEGRGLLGKTGVDARIFRVMGDNDISVSIISQGSSERGIGLVVAADKATKAMIELEKEFENDFYSKDVNKISVTDNVSVISIIGQDLSTFHKPYTALIKNKIVPILFNNTVTGKNVSLVVNKSQLHKALNVIHGEIFGVSKKINIAIFGHGLVGGTLINQILASAENIEKRKDIKLNIFAIANSKKVLLDKNGVTPNWKNEVVNNGVLYTIDDVIAYAVEHHLENLIAIDNTASASFVENYIALIENSFDLISSNKVANTLSYTFYKKLREVLTDNQKNYLYETNVGAGLPLIDTIKLLHHSGENITKIKGVFSGTLSYLFNIFSAEDRPFSEVLQEAIDKGFTEPDPREDLCGNDVGRKLLILARELDLQNEFEEINIQNLIPEHLREGDKIEFLNQLTELDSIYATIKENQKPNHVLRYIGELSGDLQREKGVLDVKLVSVPQDTALGGLKGSDSFFEIYTESYGDRPIVIQGAGAGSAVTARGVFGDILRLSEKG